MLDLNPLDEIATFLRSRFFGKYRGIVHDNAKAKKTGRLDVRVPAILGETVVSALPCVPFAGTGIGLHLVPDNGTLVWVEFEGGDASYPIWTGFFWGDNEVPSASQAAPRLLKTARHSLTFDDDGGTIEIATDQKATITLSSSIEQKAGARIIISNTGIEQKATPAGVSITAAGVSVDSGAKGKLDVTAAGVNVNNGTLAVP
jgi:hypothetical protein